jgi:hypothetical protein
MEDIVALDLRENQLWNYHIIRELWKLYSGCSVEELYYRFDIHKNVYTRIVTGVGNPRLKGKSHSLSEITGVSTRIFSGENRLAVDEIDNDLRENFIQAVIDTNDAGLDTNIRELKKDIVLRLKTLDKKTIQNESLRKLLYYIKHLKKAPHSLYIDTAIKIFQEIGTQELAEIEMNTLEKYISDLEKQYILAKAQLIERQNKK